MIVTANVTAHRRCEASGAAAGSTDFLWRSEEDGRLDAGERPQSGLRLAAHGVHYRPEHISHVNLIRVVRWQVGNNAVAHFL